MRPVQHGRRTVPTLTALLDHLTEERGDAVVAFPERGVRVTQAEIPAKAWGVAAELLRAGVTEDSVVGVLVGTEPGFFPAVFGVWAAGGAISVLPVPPMPAPAEHLAAALAPAVRELGHLIVADAQLAVAEELHRRQPELKIIRLGDCAEGTRMEPIARPESAAIVQFTSGSTARPKGVVLSHAAVLACFAATAESSTVGPDDVVVSWVPLFHDFGLITLLFGMWQGYEMHLFSAWHFVRRPRQVLEYISEVGGTVFGGPNFAYDRIADVPRSGPLDGLDLSSWRLALNGGEPVKPATAERFTLALAPAGVRETAMLPVYGMAEATMSVACPQPGRPVKAVWFDRDSLAGKREAIRVADGAQHGTGLVSVGRPVPGLSLRLVGDGGLDVAEGAVGEIVVRGPSLSSGYLRDPEATAAAFRDGWLHTGDLGVRVDGELYVAGRRKDMIIVAGRNFFAEDVEDVVRKGLQDGRGRCVAFADHDRERIIIAVETQDMAKATDVSIQVRKLVSATLDLGAIDVHAVPRNALPRTTSGKWQRALTARHFRNLTNA
ncbi:AMP-binding protein [Lentzea sp. E54]|uniref:AMP-binding protein n=1 Tax=Lentzea xerophila TaxID=3435883 RepID=UPI003DA480DA